MKGVPEVERQEMLTEFSWKTSWKTATFKTEKERGR
jgi:hypothetical protein